MAIVESIILFSTPKKCRHIAAILCRDSATNYHTLSYPSPPDLLFTNSTITIVGRDSSVGIATRYGPDGPGIEPRWGGGVRFSSPAQTATGSHPASYTRSTGSSRG